MRTALKNSIETLYKTFDVYNVTYEQLIAQSCPCCISPVEAKALFAQPLKELDEDSLGLYMRSAISTIGTDVHYRHFLPRILELMSFPNSNFTFDFIDYEKLNYSQWQDWPSEEIEAIQNYFIQLWQFTVTHPKSTNREIGGVLEVVSFYHLFDQALDIWKQYTSPASLLFAVENVLYGPSSGLSDHHLLLLSEFWSSPLFLDRLESLFFQTKDVINANRISIVYTILERRQFNDLNYA